MAYKKQKYKTYKTEKDGVTLKKGKDGFPEYTFAQKIALNKYKREFDRYWEEERILCAQRNSDCQENYYLSPFYKFVGIEKESFYDGNDYKIGNDRRYYLFNQIHEMGLPLEEVLADNPSLEEESLLYYYIYQNTIIVTHGFYDLTLNTKNDKHYIERDYERNPELYWYYEMNGIETNPYVDDFRKTHLDKHIRAEHKHLQMKILYTKRSYKSMNMVTDKFDSYSDAIFYKELRELKKIFAK